MPITDFNEIADVYDEDLENLLGKYMWGGAEKYTEYKVQLAHILLKKKNIRSILDFGCGVGRSLKYLAAYFYGTNLFGCDVSDDELQIAKKNYPLAHYFNNADIDEFSNLKDKFDLIFTSCVLHHIAPTERKIWVNAVVDKLTPDGYWAIFEHNLINPYTKRIITDVDNKVDDINWMYTKKKLLALFSERKDIIIFWHGYTLFSPFRFTSKKQKKSCFSYLITSFERLFKWCPLGAQQCVIIKKQENKYEEN
jgi:SAM-dependent methyltransferase